MIPGVGELVWASSASTHGSMSAASAAATLEQAFVSLTGTRDAVQVSHDMLQALER